MSFVRVALDVPLASLFDYRSASASSDDIGRRVLVPFGKKIAVGVIMGLARDTALPLSRVRPILSVLHDLPPLPSDILDLLRFSSDYYHYPLGEIALSALPTRLRRRQSIKTPTARRLRLTALGRTIAPDSLPKRATIKRELLKRLCAAESDVDEAALLAVTPRAGAALKTLIEKEWVESIAVSPTGFPASSLKALPSDYVLTDEQRLAIDQVRGAPVGFIPWLLRGVTGSGKTEVYLQLAADALAAGRQVLFLVPEINLTPQLEALVRARFPAAALVALHSALNESERLHNWLAAQSGAADIVLGTRLAVFAPLPRLGLIVIDEEHDTSFKQAEGFRYSARDLALVRGQQRAVPVILGSATPALETFHQAITGRYRMLTLERRVNGMPPLIECIDTRREALIEGLAQSLLNAVRETTAKGDQSLIFINRRGYAPVLVCTSCGWAAGCHRCSANMVLHREAAHLRCHHCGSRERLPPACPQCGNQDLLALGQGTQRVQTALARIFPNARILRIDGDSTRPKHAWREMKRQIEGREVDVLVGTQILAKGHDFPQLNLVGVINADNSLYSTDFRAAEHLFARLTQVAGRAGRGTSRGRVLIQTQFPTHPLYEALRRDDYPAYAHALLAERKQAGFPPFVHQALLRAEANQLTLALGFLTRAAREAAKIGHGVTIYDPVPATLVRRAGLERAQLTVQAHSRPTLHAFLAAWRPRLDTAAARRVRWSLDVDPLEV